MGGFVSSAQKLRGVSTHLVCKYVLWGWLHTPRRAVEQCLPRQACLGGKPHLQLNAHVEQVKQKNNHPIPAPCASGFGA
eukprot:4860613-Amphidinium_carterae.1